MSRTMSNVSRTEEERDRLLFCGPYAPRDWVVIRARGGMERTAVEALRENGVAAYCPMETVWRPSRRPRTHKRSRAVVPGYVFVDLPEGFQLPRLTKLAGVWGALFCNGDVATVPSRFVRNMLLVEIFGGFDWTVERKRERGKRPDAKGQKVKVAAGKWQGAIGEIVRVPRNERAKVLVTVVSGKRVTTQKVDIALDELELEDA